ncbi:MAG: long-chain fatty acid--CoA ligase [Rhodospirillaceae bacterium]|nr:long-chain fatty acid--CoA ligase [Rhodospirillaceae bacterium]|tara:strand:- start:4539 stop:6176 length:1638 start_codon:yes stop_codon:yes gene_type:complete
MDGLMMDRPLLISSLIEFGARYHSKSEIVSRSVEGPIHRYSMAEANYRSKQLAQALTRLGVGKGERIATIAWNGYRHFELYFGVSGMGAVCHTINPRLFHEQIVYVINHAKDKYVFIDLTFVPLLEALAAHLPNVAGYVIMTEKEHMPETKLDNALCYEELLASENGDYTWPEFAEHTASSLCYTSGTTGNPKGVLYSHRSTVLHTFAVCAAGGAGPNTRSRYLSLVPMFHVNAWGLPYGCAMTGAKLVLPGPSYQGDAIFDLMDAEKVDKAAGVPTLWMLLLSEMQKRGRKPEGFETLVVGGSAFPASMIEAYEDKFGVNVHHAWGMTELSPIGTIGTLLPSMDVLSKEERRAIKTTQGRAVFGVEKKIVDQENNRLPEDGNAFGELLVRGLWTASSYYNDPEATAKSFTEDGWFRTGDVVTLDENGIMNVVDRSKDVIKSAGEWISSIDLENAAMGHPAIREAAVIGMPHPKWDERPLLVAVPAQGESAPTLDEVKEFLADKVAKWWLPDDLIILNELPYTATGKVSKLNLREQLKGYSFPGV